MGTKAHAGMTGYHMRHGSPPKLKDLPCPDRPADGEFRTFQEWVDTARKAIGGTGALCFDAKGRQLHNGAHFRVARDEGTFPVRWYLP